MMPSQARRRWTGHQCYYRLLGFKVFIYGSRTIWCWQLPRKETTFVCLSILLPTCQFNQPSLEIINILPSIPWKFWDGWASTHLQHRKTITPPKTRSSLARMGEPGHRGKTIHLRWLKMAYVFKKRFSLINNVSYFFRFPTLKHKTKHSMT